jgi:hypothetical protein
MFWYSIFYISFDSNSLECFFNFNNFFKLILFLILSFNIKLVENWVFWLSSGLGSHGSRHGRLTWFKRFVVFLFFKFLFFLVLSFNIYLTKDWAPLLFFICFLQVFSLILKKVWLSHVESFYLLFFVKSSPFFYKKSCF